MKKIKSTMVSVLVLLLVFSLVLGGGSLQAKSKSKTFEMTSDVLYGTRGESQSTNFALRVSAVGQLALVGAQPGVKKTVLGKSGATGQHSEASDSRPEHFSLSQNYPNPFNPQTSISYALPQDGQVRLIVYNIAGRRVRTLVDEYQPAGNKTVIWDGRDEEGKLVASGVYLYKLQAGRSSAVKKMLLVK